jgi:isocitrate dehydrogenase kinase/phosphatase
MQYHGDLTDPAYWARKQARVGSGVQEDVFSYPEAMRFRRRPQPSG